MATAKKSAGAKKSATSKTSSKSTARSSSAASGRGASAKSAPAKSAAKSAAKKAPATKAAAKTATKAAAKKAPSKTSTGSRGPNAAFMKPMQPSPELSAVVGNEPQPRSQITSRVWDYIKKNNLQDATNRRQINADDNLRKVFGGKANVTMFEMTKLVNNHLKDA